MKLLFVEDNATVGRAIAKSLRAQGHDVTLAQSYADARAVSGYHDIGLFDITLADGDGIELCELMLREQRVGAALFCSGSIDDLLLERAERTARVVSKEVSFWDLCDAIVETGATAPPHPISSAPPKA